MSQSRTTTYAISLLAACASAYVLFIVVTDIVLFLNPRAFVLDAQMYWAVGRGLLNGLLPYKDLFEIKPPGVFLLSAASLTLFSNGMLGNIVGAFTLFAIPAVAVFAAWVVGKHHPKIDRLLLVAFAFLSAGFWAAFVSEKGQPWQTEVFGSLFALLYVSTLTFSWKHRWLRVTIAAIGLLGSIGFKEPFIFSCFAAAVLTAKKPKDLLQSFFIPLAAALFVGMIVGAILGFLRPYISYYLPALRYRGYAFGPIWLRSFAVIKVLRNLWQVSLLAPAGVIALFGWITWVNAPERGLSKSIGQVLLAFYLALLAVGAAGDYQSHHFVFLSPLILAAIFLCIHHLSDRRVLMCMVGVWSLVAFGLSQPSFSLQNPAQLQTVETVAARIDQVLDRCHLNRYLLIKRDGLIPFGFTKHSPLNHALFQQIDNGAQYGQQFLEISLDRMSQASVIIFPLEGFAATQIVGNAMNEYIMKTFSEEAPPCAVPLPDLPGYGFLFRAKPDPFTEKFKWQEPTKETRIR